MVCSSFTWKANWNQNDSQASLQDPSHSSITTGPISLQHHGPVSLCYHLWTCLTPASALTMHWAFLHHLLCQITPNCTCVLDPPCPQFEMTAREIEAFRATQGTDVSLLSEHTSPKHKKKKQVLPMNATMKITAGDAEVGNKVCAPWEAGTCLRWGWQAAQPCWNSAHAWGSGSHPAPQLHAAWLTSPSRVVQARPHSKKPTTKQKKK